MENITIFKFDTTFKKIIQTLITLENETESDDRVSYKPLYMCSFNGITDLLEYLYTLSNEHDVTNLIFAIKVTIEKLQEVQKKTENMFIEQPREL